MKALFVIDVGKDELGEAVATITANDTTFFARGVIRPLPEECDDATEIYNAHGEVDCYQLTDYAEGWNACLEEIQNDN